MRAHAHARAVVGLAVLAVLAGCQLAPASEALVWFEAAAPDVAPRLGETPGADADPGDAAQHAGDGARHGQVPPAARSGLPGFRVDLRPRHDTGTAADAQGRAGPRTAGAAGTLWVDTIGQPDAIAGDAPPEDTGGDEPGAETTDAGDAAVAADVGPAEAPATPAPESPCGAGCGDGNPCTVDACDATAGECTHLPVAAPCDDGDACTAGDSCVCAGGVPGGATCACAGTPIACDDGQPCTADACEPQAGCVATPLPSGSPCGAGSCSGTWFQAAGTCQGGTCTLPPPVDCSDANDCTADSCSPAAGCAVSPAPYGTPCQPSSKWLLQPYCAGTACVGAEIFVWQTKDSDFQGLTGIDRGVDGNLHVSARLAAPDQGMVAKFNPASAGTSLPAFAGTALVDLRGRLAVGAAGAGPMVSAWTPAKKQYQPQPGLLAALTRPLRAVDLAQTGDVERYLLAGDPDLSQANWNALVRLDHGPGGWTPPLRLGVGTVAGAGCAQVALAASDVYVASPTSVFAVGTLTGPGGPAGAAVAWYDGNTTTHCGDLGALAGLATVASAAPQDVVLPLTGPGAVGPLQAIHGTSPSHVLAGGAQGTLLWFDGLAWTSLSPQVPGAAIPWGPAFDVRDVHVAGNVAWVVGVHTQPDPAQPGAQCQSPFALHGVFQGGAWTWVRSFVPTKLVVYCATEPDARFASPLERAWIDPQTGTVWLVGAAASTGNGGTDAYAPTETWQMIWRIKNG